MRRGKTLKAWTPEQQANSVYKPTLNWAPYCEWLWSLCASWSAVGKAHWSCSPASKSCGYGTLQLVAFGLSSAEPHDPSCLLVFAREETGAPYRSAFVMTLFVPSTYLYLGFSTVYICSCCFSCDLGLMWGQQSFLPHYLCSYLYLFG